MVQRKIKLWYKMTEKCNTLIVLICLLNIILISDCASVRSADSKVYIVTPEPSESSEARNFPYFIPTPVPDDDGDAEKMDSQFEDKHQDTPDIIMAEFKPGNGKPNERMISVKEMLSKEKIDTYSTPKNIQDVSSKGKVEDVWDIIKHNQNLEPSTKRNIVENTKSNNMPKATDILMSPSVESEFHYVSSDTKLMSSYKSKSNNELKATEILMSPSIDSQYNYETKGNEGTIDNNAWINSKQNPEIQSGIDSPPQGSSKIDEPRTIRGNENSWNFPDSRSPTKVNYYGGYDNYNTGYGNLDTSKYDYIAPGEAQDRFNPAQPYLPPKLPPPPPAQMPPPPPPPKMPPPPPPAQMPPPPPPMPPKPKDVMSPPGPSFDSIPPYPSHDDSKPPDSVEYSYLPPGDSDNFPTFIYDDDHHHHHHDDEDLHFYHHPPPPPPPPPPTTTTTAAPEKRNTNRFSYYYLGKKLWYLPLYFSVYFIIYIGTLIIKSIARHKITYPQHFKNKRALDGMLSEEIIDNMSRMASNAFVKMAEKYFESKLS